MGLLLLSLLSIFSVEGLTCLHLDGVIEGAANSSVLETGDQLLLSDRGIFFDSVATPFTEIDRHYFTTRAEAVELLDCEFQFFDLLPTSRGFVQYCRAATSDLELVLIHQPDRNQIDVVQGGVRYFTSRCQVSDDTTPQLAIASAVVDTVSWEYNVGFGDSIPYIYEPVVFESAIDTVLVRDASSTEPTIRPAIFETVTEVVLVREENLCKELDTEYEIVTEQVLVKEAYAEILQIPAVWDTATEQVQIRPPHLTYDILQPTFEIDSMEVIAIPERYSVVKQWSGDCHTFGVDCVDYTVEVIPQVDTVLAFQRAVCPDGYVSTPLCVREVEHPAVYTNVQRQVLLQPLTFEFVQKEAVYGTIQHVRITNDFEIPDSCIQFVYEDRTYEKLVLPGTATFIEQAAHYRSVATEVVRSPEQIHIEDTQEKIVFTETVSGMGVPEVLLPTIDSIFVTDQVWEDIGAALVDKAYLSPAYQPDRDSIYKSLYQYMCAEQYFISGLRTAVLEGLGVHLDNDLETDTVTATLSAPTYTELVNYPDEYVVSTCSDTYLVERISEQTFDVLHEVTYAIPDIGLVHYRNMPGEPIVRAALTGTGDLQTVIDLGLSSCQVFTVPAICGGPVDIPVRATGTDTEGRRYVEFDLLLDDCPTTEETYFRFVEGIGTNAGIWYEVVDDKVTTRLHCATNTDGVLVYETTNMHCTTATTDEKETDRQGLLYPNPASTYVRVQQGYQLEEIIDIHGSSMTAEYGTAEIDLTKLPAGTYTVLLRGERGQMHRERLVIY